MKKLLYSPVLAAFVLSAGLVTSAVVISRARMSAPGEQVLTEQVIKSQFVTQMTEQMGKSPIIDMTGNKRLLSEVVIDKFQMSPKRNHAEIDYHFAWQNTELCTFTQMSLTKDEYGRFDSGDVSGMLDPNSNKHFRVIVR